MKKTITITLPVGDPVRTWSKLAPFFGVSGAWLSKKYEQEGPDGPLHQIIGIDHTVKRDGRGTPFAFLEDLEKYRADLRAVVTGEPAKRFRQAATLRRRRKANA